MKIEAKCNHNKGLELIQPSAIICLANGVRTKVAGSVAVASTPLPATVRSAIVVSRIAATVRAKTRFKAAIDNLLCSIHYKRVTALTSLEVLHIHLHSVVLYHFQIGLAIRLVSTVIPNGLDKVISQLDNNLEITWLQSSNSDSIRKNEIIGFYMKAKDLVEAGELKHKIRTVKDLVNYISIKENKETSNYSIFLGAGASRSSGISTAFELIVEWMEELYERYNYKKFELNDGNEDDIHIRYRELKIYFEREQASWFDATNPYSSLFEKKFDLAPQRRRFIEKEVDGKLPSIGYAYLVSLVKNNYFNSIFTTNFDDLINEAFYQLSNRRPIVCAHDSSVHSISVTSQRPKIIKLHGDYLFEDIKSTLRETESLENNIKDKLIEFCKEYGLIVIGYSGNDRSIMDTLEYLIKSESYLKNGIYWCIREDDEINPKLKSFFWKDGVYPVIIKGFDEFFNILHQELLGSTRVFNTYGESKQQKIIQKIINNKNNFDDEDIKKDIEILEYESETQSLSAIISEGIYEDNESPENRATIQDHKNFLEIDKVASNDLKEAYRRSVNYYLEAQNDSLKTLWLAKLIDFSRRLNLDFDHDKWADELIKLDVNNFNYYLPKIRSFKNLKERMFEVDLDRYKEHFHNDFEYLNYVISLKFEVINNYKSYSKDKTFIDQLTILTESSLKIEPSLSNKSWFHKINALHCLYKIASSGDEKDKIKKKAIAFLNTAKNINNNSIYTLNLETNYANFFDDKDYAKVLIEDLRLRFTTSSKADQHSIKKLIDKLFTNTELSFSKNDRQDFYLNLIDSKNLDDPIEVLVSRIQFLFLYNFDSSLIEEEITNILKNRRILDHIDKIITIAKYINSELIDKIDLLLKAKEINISPVYFNGFMSLIKEEQGDLEKSIIYLEKKYSYKPLDSDYYSRKSFLLLKNREYSKLDVLLNDFKNNDFDFDCSVLIINAMYSYKINNDKKYNTSDLYSIISKAKPKDKLTSIAAKLIIGSNYQQALSDIKKLINNDREYYLVFNDWIILEDIDKASLRELIKK